MFKVLREVDGGKPNNGPDFVAEAVCQWLKHSGRHTTFINPGSPQENGYVESFIDKLSDECLNREVFQNVKEAQTMWKHRGGSTITTDRTVL